MPDSIDNFLEAVTGAGIISIAISVVLSVDLNFCFMNSHSSFGEALSFVTNNLRNN